MAESNIKILEHFPKLILFHAIKNRGQLSRLILISQSKIEFPTAESLLLGETPLRDGCRHNLHVQLQHLHKLYAAVMIRARPIIRRPVKLATLEYVLVVDV